VVDLFQIILAHAAMTLKPFIAAGLLLTLGACALPPEYPTLGLSSSEHKAAALMSELSRVATLSAEQRRREVAALDAIRRPDPARRFQLAALLERDDNPESLERSLKTLNAMPDDDARTQALVELMKRSLKARIELRQQTTRNLELQDKLEQIKTLEKSLQQRTTPSGTP
jgi:hypothetical protein